MDFKQQIAQLIAPHAGITGDEAYTWLETPPNADMGNYAFPCFRLAKVLRKAPPAIAAQLVEALNARGLPQTLDAVQAAGGYLNFTLNPAALAQAAIQGVRASGMRYGASDEGAGRVICIDYSSINIAKRFHIGHLMTTVLGNALYKMYAFLGYKPVGINHLGDWGTQFGKMIAAYLHWGDRGQVEQRGIDELQALYVRFHDEAEKDPALEEEGRAWFKKIEDGDPQATALFDWFKQLTLRDAKRVYDLLGIEFDSYAGESFYNDKMGRVLDELTQKGLLEDSEGAKVVKLDEFNLPPCLMVKRDGATLYATRDIAAALYRKDTYHFDKSLYVVAYQQNLHFAQFFRVLEKMGYDWAKDLVHVAYGMVSLEDGAMSTRHGRVVYLDDLLSRAIDQTRQIMREKTPDLADAEAVARQVGVGAVIFWALSNNRIKDVVFSWERALNFDGETGPYVQYTHARCKSVLRKAGQTLPEQVDYSCLADAEAQRAARLVLDFPQVVREACNRYEPSLVTRHIVDIAQAYNKFYYEHRILDEDAAVQGARLALTEAVSTVLAVGLSLLGIAAPDRM